MNTQNRIDTLKAQMSTLMEWKSQNELRQITIPISTTSTKILQQDLIVATGVTKALPGSYTLSALEVMIDEQVLWLVIIEQ